MSYTEAENSPPRMATNSMPMYINHVQCSGEELTLLDCSYSRHHTDIDHSKDVGVHCRKGKILASLLILCNSLGQRYTLYNKFTQSNVILFIIQCLVMMVI